MTSDVIQCRQSEIQNGGGLPFLCFPNIIKYNLTIIRGGAPASLPAPCFLYTYFVIKQSGHLKRIIFVADCLHISLFKLNSRITLKYLSIITIPFSQSISSISSMFVIKNLFLEFLNFDHII